MKRLRESSRSTLGKYLGTKPTVYTELLYLFPLALIYHVGAKITGVYDGVDVVSMALFFMEKAFPPGVWLVEGAVLLAFAVLYREAKKKEGFEWRYLWKAMAEAALYAGTIGTVVILVLLYVFRIQPTTAGPPASSAVEAIQISAGAGLYEELVFRMGLYGWLLGLFGRKKGWSKWKAFPAAAGLSGFVFALAHHVPPGGEAITLWALAYRSVTGVLLAAVYEWRGLAVAAYTHSLYDVAVFMAVL